MSNFWLFSKVESFYTNSDLYGIFNRHELSMLADYGLNLIDAVKMSVFLERCVSAEDLDSAVL